MKILVTGAAGFIGNAIAKELKGSDHEVILTDILMPDELHGHAYTYADLTNQDAVNNLPDVDVVYHMCAYNNTAHFYSKPMSVIDSTLTPTIYLLQRYKSIKKFIYASSSEIYAGAIQLGISDIPTPEVNVGVINGIDNPRWSYAGSKLMGEILVHAAHVEHGLNYAIIRYHNVYGKRQKAHFIPEYAERIQNDDRTLYGADQTRAFLYIDDAAKLTAMVADVLENDTIHIGNPKEITIKLVAAMIRDILLVHTKPEYKDAPEGSVDRRCADISKLLELFPDFKFTGLDEGLRKTLL